MTRISLILLAAPLALTGTIAAAPAVAQDPDVRSVVVRYDDLNLASASGRERLTTRVRMAVRTVCGGLANPSRDLRARVLSRKCEENARRDADVKLARLFNGNGTQFASEGQVVVAAP